MITRKKKLSLTTLKMKAQRLGMLALVFVEEGSFGSALQPPLNWDYYHAHFSDGSVLMFGAKTRRDAYERVIQNLDR